MDYENDMLVKSSVDLLTHINPNDEKDDSYYVIEVCFNLADASLRESGVYEYMDFKSDKYIQIFKDAIYAGYHRWKSVVDILNRDYHQEQVSFTYLMIVLYMMELPMPEELSNLMKESVNYVINQEEGFLKTEVSGVDNVNDSTMDEDELAKVFANSDKNLVNEFFNIFSSMSSFQRDVNKYDNAEDVNKHHKLMWIYRQMLRKSEGG